MSKVTRHTLANGMTILLKEVHSAPLIAWVVLYRVGSRNERTGQTGISHWVEHMMFKGTERFPASVLDKAIDRLGGQWNAYTSMDHTSYFEVLPADKVNLALELEADRMVNATFDPEEVESERTVIISERGMSENHPMFWLDEEMEAAAFRVHGYHHQIIGDMTDLETMTREDLYNHSRQHYVPANAVGVAVGAFDSAEMLEKIRQHYENIPMRTMPETFSRQEPPQNGERRVEVLRPSNNSFVAVGYRVPQATHEDWFPLLVMDSILTGPGGGIGNKTSRMYQALVVNELASQVYGYIYPSVDPYLYNTTMVVRDGQSPQSCLDAYDAVIAEVVENGFTEAELDKARKQARAAHAYGTERVSEQAFELARAEHFASYTWAEEFPERIQAVTLEQINSVAKRYLRRSNRTVGFLIPQTEEVSA